MRDDSCAELVELVTDLLEGALTPVLADQVAHHLAGCPGCEAYVDQMRQTAEALRARGGEEAGLPDGIRDRLIEAWGRRGSSGG